MTKAATTIEDFQAEGSLIELAALANDVFSSPIFTIWLIRRIRVIEMDF